MSTHSFGGFNGSQVSIKKSQQNCSKILSPKKKLKNFGRYSIGDLSYTESGFSFGYASHPSGT